MTAPFPQTMDYSGHNAPSRIECDIYDLVVEGNLPPEIRGIWYQSVPDPQYHTSSGKDTFLRGDGLERSFAFDGAGHVDFKQRYIRTERWLLEHQARKALFGAYRNPFTDDPAVAGGKRRSAANTAPFFHGGRVLAFKEDSPPWEVDPLTLETKGEWTFGGKLHNPDRLAIRGWIRPPARCTTSVTRPPVLRAPMCPTSSPMPRASSSARRCSRFPTAR